MHFDLDEDERALQAGIRELARGRIGMDRVRRSADAHGVDRELFAELAGAGVFALTMREEDGGLGLGATHAAVVFEELGRVLAPGPLVGTHLAAGGVDGAAEGTAVVGVVERARVPGVVEHLPALDALLVLDDDGVHLLAPAELAATPVPRPLDPATPIWEVADLLDGEQVGGPAQVEVLRRRRDLLVAAQLVGTAAATTELAVAYAKEREQFGKPIGTFQAVKHLCADMLTRAEVARAAVHSAAVHLDDPGVGDVGRALAAASLLAGEAAVKNAKSCIQVHGGMGFTWEVDAHLHLKRAVAWRAQVPAEDELAEAVAATL